MKKATYYSLAGAANTLGLHSTTLIRAVDLGRLKMHLKYTTGVYTQQMLFTGAALRAFQKSRIVAYTAAITSKRRQSAARLKKVRVK